MSATSLKLDIYNWFHSNLICIIAHAYVIIHWYLFEQIWKNHISKINCTIELYSKFTNNSIQGGRHGMTALANRLSRLSVHLSFKQSTIIKRFNLHFQVSIRFSQHMSLGFYPNFGYPFNSKVGIFSPAYLQFTCTGIWSQYK